MTPLAHCGALPPPSPTIWTSAASSSRSPSTSPSRSASKNRAASSSRSRRSASNRGRPASMWRRARTASWRHAASDRPTADAISRKAEPEHLAQHEDRPLERAEPLEQQQRRHRHRVGQLRRPLRVLVGVGEQRLGEPRPDVLLPPDAGRAQHVDRDPGHHGREEGLGRRRVVSARPRSAARSPGPRPRPRSRCRGSGRRSRTAAAAAPRTVALGHVSSSLKPWCRSADSYLRRIVSPSCDIARARRRRVTARQTYSSTLT